MIRRFRFRRLGSRLLLLLSGLLALTQLTTYLLVAQANRRNALRAIEDDLARGSRQFQAIVRQREIDLQLAARMMAGDYALRQLFLMEEFSPPTARSALFSYRERIGAPVIVMLDADGTFLADTRYDEAFRDHTPFFELQAEADLSEEYEATGWGYMENTLHQIVVVPVLAPPPEAVAWIGLGFPIDRTTADELKGTSALEVSFLSAEPEERPRLLASTLPDALAEALRDAAKPTLGTLVTNVDLHGERYLTTFRRLETAARGDVWIVLQRSLEAELAPARLLENILLLTTLAGLALAMVAALAVARTVTRPVRQLAQHTRLIAAGDYTAHLDLDRSDELGQLADAFNAMSEGLAERDQVRDLLDKNVSPEVAASLLRDGASLGGEERLVTVVFADLRGFTPLSERLPPRDLVTLLNRYLDVMSAEIESRGGVIDKYIGDEIMALFGAPVAMADGPDRAVQSALGMREALARLNVELVAEGHPALAFGVGINTAHVIAGNIGSHRRLNYSVLGDGVNLAARLQPLTRREEYQTDILISSQTRDLLREAYRLREVDTVTVKGRTSEVRLFAVDGRAEPEPDAR